MLVNLHLYQVAIGVFNNFAFLTNNIFTHYTDAIITKWLNLSVMVNMTIILLFYIFAFYNQI